MTDEEINMAIAEACGFVLCGEFSLNKDSPVFRYWIYPKDWNGPSEQPWCPNFCNDLNAMHEAEKMLNTDELFERYYLALYDTTRSTLWPVCATARQRAEAFLRTLGRWKEAK